MNNFVDLLKMVSFPIHKEGFKFILIFALASSAYLLAWLIIKLLIPEIKPLYYNSTGKIK